jgi:hypothetical protein
MCGLGSVDLFMICVALYASLCSKMLGVGLDFVEDNEFFLLMKEVDDSNDDNSVRMVGSG